MENSEDICFNSSISSWIIDYYFENIQYKDKIIIGIYDMFIIYQIIDSTITLEKFFSLCENKLKENKNDSFIGKYNQYLNQYNLIDIIDIFHQCQFYSSDKIIVLKNENIHNHIDQLFAQYFMELSSKMLLTNENIQKQEIIMEKMNIKNYLKHTLCMYLSLLIDTQNEYALNHCLIASSNLGISSKHQNLLSYLRHDDKSSNIPNKSYSDIKEFIEQLRILIEDNENLKIESSITFRKILEFISKQFKKTPQYDTIIKDIIEEFCQYFQTIKTKSASSKAKLIFQSIIHLSTKQILDLPIFQDLSDILPMKTKQIKKYRSLDLSIIHETSFEIDESKPSIKNLQIKRQPLKVIDINTFNNEERIIDEDKNFQEYKLISDDDKENLPVKRTKRLILSTKNDPPNKKHKKLGIQSKYNE